ncbi:globin domain-containing protein, partial [Pseudonocardia pini]|uniref:globin domain-containing protein n=1 Tax=Pseudonocardia pini TaxID=2758030 RepID=UPI0028ABB27D
MTTDSRADGRADSGLGEIARHLDLARRSVADLALDDEWFVPHFYRTLFGYAPGLRALFPLSMGTQHARFGRALLHVVTHLGEPEKVVGFLAQLGRDHRKFDVREEHYAAVGRALLATLAETAGEAWTPEVAEAW